MPSVSAIIPAYNSAATIAQAIESALSQTYSPTEIFVIDDGSSDATADIVSHYPAPVRLLRKSNGGPASARNLGARHATGEWLALLDADDWWYPNKLERQLACYTSPKIGMIQHFCQDMKIYPPERLDFEAMWQKNHVMNSTALIRREVFEAMGGFDEARDLISVEDYHLWLRIAAAGWEIATCREELGHYTRGIGLSSDSARFQKASLYCIESVAKILKLSEAKLRAKRRDMLLAFGRNALFHREIPAARKLLTAAWSQGPTIKTGMMLGASYVPKGLLNARRELYELLEGPLEGGTLFGTQVQTADLPAAGPFLIVIVDTEEDFDWDSGFPKAMNVESMKHQDRAQRILEKHKVVASYAVDFAVASQRDGFAPLLEFLADGACEIASQLHPWLNPPLDEEVNTRNSFLGNLPTALEYAKVRVLTHTIEDNFQVKPLLFRTGRFGLGPNTAKALDDFGYRVDSSVRPYFDDSDFGGPDYRNAPTKPFWFGPGNRILELPATVGMTGLLAGAGRTLYPKIRTDGAARFHIPGVMARSHLLDRIQLTPEGISLDEAKRVTRVLRRRDRQQVFVLSYHSPSLVPGNTPYVRSDKDLRRFLDWLDGYLDFFRSEMGGTMATPRTILDMMDQRVVTPATVRIRAPATELVG
jgi:glycosyltransferase involved in cell wall biosynthesis